VCSEVSMFGCQGYRRMTGLRCDPGPRTALMTFNGSSYVNVATPYRLSWPRVPAMIETFVLIDRETEGSLADASYTRTHRLHHIIHGHTASRTSSAPWRVPRNDADAPRITEPQARHARKRPTTGYVCAAPCTPRSYQNSTEYTLYIFRSLFFLF
jgi:hypothetical protein